MRAGAVALVFGTRPELVKLAPLQWELGPAAHWIHTGQHPWASLIAIAADLDIGAPQLSCTIAATPPGRQIGEAIAAVTDALTALAPTVVIVQGDTNSTLAGAIAATTLGVPVVHVEAGLRAFDRSLPEERNRVVVDHIAHLLCAPTDLAAAHLRAEGIADDTIVVTGNTVVDALRRVLPDRDQRVAFRAPLGLDADRYVLATLHRRENVDDPRTLATIVGELSRLPIPVVFPVHPRTVDRARHAGIDLECGAISAVGPLGYRAFLALAADAAVLVTDSGGVQEEASVLGRPTVVVRRSTERPEVLGTVTTRVDPGPAIGEAVRAQLSDLAAVHRNLAAIPSPYGDGQARFRTLAAIERLVTDR